MHLTLLLVALTVAGLLRLQPINPGQNWQERWWRSLGLFLFSPLLLTATAIALAWMGPRGQMVRWWEGWFSYSLAVLFLGFAVLLAIKLAGEGWLSLRRVREYPLWELKGTSARLLPTSIPFVARVGFWRSELVVSQGVLDALDADHLEAVLTHEQAHLYYRDTFWFFWLGWLRRLTFWLPQTEILWQELLLLREHRADCWAAQSVDTLLLAESLVKMVSAPTLYSEIASVAFSNALPHNRLEERIEVLLSQPKPLQQTGLWIWAWLVSGFLPLLVVPFHY